MRKFGVILILLFLFTLNGCGHQHTWLDATCITPTTCSECGETEGKALGHLWTNATCTVPKTCSRCGETQGEATGHKWIEVSCATPKTCTRCGATEGKALGHVWIDATCTDPKTCSRCGRTEGEALGHDAPGLNCIDDAICSRCNSPVTALGHDFSEATCTEPAKCTVCGEASGEALGHNVTSGVCDRCGLEIYETVIGNGDDVVSDISVGNGIYRVRFTHFGARNFVVKSYDATGDRELLINEIGNYDGYVLLSGEAPYSFEITADGSWNFTVEKLNDISDTSFVGKGDYVTGLCTISSGAWEITHDGQHHFAVRVYTSDGRDLLVNEIGTYSGKKMITVSNDSYAFFEITADGNWTIKKA